MLNPSADKLGTKLPLGAGQSRRAGRKRARYYQSWYRPADRTPEHIVQAGIRALQDGAHGYITGLLPA